MTTDVIVTLNYSTKLIMSEKDAAALLQILSRTSCIETSVYEDGEYQKCTVKGQSMEVTPLKESLETLAQEAEVLDIPLHKFIKETKGIHF